MSTTALTTITVAYSGDVAGTETRSDTNTASPGQMQILTLSAGDNTITVPGGGSTPVSVMIVKPAGNTQAITFKGSAGDTGRRLHNTITDRITLDPSVTNFILNAAGQVAGLILFWS